MDNGYKYWIGDQTIEARQLAIKYYTKAKFWKDRFDELLAFNLAAERNGDTVKARQWENTARALKEDRDRWMKIVTSAPICAHCKKSVTDIDNHWRECEVHPAGKELRRFRNEIKKLKGRVHYLEHFNEPLREELEQLINLVEWLQVDQCKP